MCHMCDEYEADLKRIGLVEESKPPRPEPRHEKREVPPAPRNPGNEPADARR